MLNQPQGTQTLLTHGMSAMTETMPLWVTGNPPR